MATSEGAAGNGNGDSGVAPKPSEEVKAAEGKDAEAAATPTAPSAEAVPPIELARGDVCSIDGLKTAELNGLTCTLFRQDAESGRWEVKLPDGEVKALRPGHLIFRSIGPIEDDGSLTLISMASDHQTIHRVLDSVRDLIRTGSEALALLGSVVSPLGGRKAQGEEGRIWLKLAKQAENRVRGTLEDLQKNMEQVDGIDASRYGPKAAAEIRLARKDLVQFVQKAQEQLESGLSRLRIVLKHLVSTVPSARSAHGWSEEESLHEKYRAAFEKLEEVVDRSSDAAKKTRLSGITVKFQGRGENPPPSDNLYVKGLPGWVTEADLETIFTEVGDIQSMKLKAADWGAIAFIRLANKTQAARAIAKYNNRVPRLLEKKAEEVDAKKLSAEITKGMLRATVDQLARGLTVIVDLKKPLGCVFNDHLATKSVQEDGQGFELGIRVSWRVRSIGGIKVQSTNELKERMAKLKSEGHKEAALVFSPPPIVASFTKRPFGFTVAKDADLGLIYVNASNGLCRAQGVRPGALLSNIGGTDVSGFKIEQVRDMLLKADVPLSVHFEQARGLPNAVTGVLHPVPDEEMPQPAVEETDDGPLVVPPPVDLEIDLSVPLGLTFNDRLVVETVQKNSQASRLGITPGWQVLGLAGDELSGRKELEQKLEVFKAEGSLGQSMMFQPTAVTAARAKELGAASAAALMRERALMLEREEEEARKNMEEVTLEVDVSQPLGILFNKFLEADQVNGGSQSARLGVQPGWRAVSLAGEKFKETRELVAKIQALKEEGTTSVSAVFLAPAKPAASAAPEPAPEPPAEKPKPMEVSTDLTLDLSQPLGIGFRDNLEAKEIKSGSQGATLGIEPGWRLVTLNGEALSNSKELVAKIKGLKSGGATSASSSWKRPAPEDLEEVIMDPSQELGVAWDTKSLTVQAVPSGCQAERLGVQLAWQLRLVQNAAVNNVEDFESKLKALRESNGQAPTEVTLSFSVPGGSPPKRARTE